MPVVSQLLATHVLSLEGTLLLLFQPADRAHSGVGWGKDLRLSECLDTSAAQRCHGLYY